MSPSSPSKPRRERHLVEVTEIHETLPDGAVRITSVANRRVLSVVDLPKPPAVVLETTAGMTDAELGWIPSDLPPAA